MEQHWLERIKWWACEKVGHRLDKGWIYEGKRHSNCAWCGRIVSKPVKGDAGICKGE